MSDDLKDPSKLRQNRNQDLLRKMKSGESLSSFNSMMSWYPDRPPIEKDPELMKQLYGQMPKPQATLARKAKEGQEKSLVTNPGLPSQSSSSSNGSQETSGGTSAGCPIVDLSARRRESKSNKSPLGS